MLVRGKNKLRGETAVIFAESLRQLQLEVGELTSEYFDVIAEKEEEIKRVKSERIRIRMFRMLERRMDEFEEVIDRLMQDFKNIVNEKVNVFP